MAPLAATVSQRPAVLPELAARAVLTQIRLVELVVMAAMEATLQHWVAPLEMVVQVVQVVQVEAAH